jgi:hypothetical protein
MTTTTQYNPAPALNAALLKSGASKTVYALVTPQLEATKLGVLTDPKYMEMFRGAWTSKQDVLHEDFFDAWAEWSEPVVRFDRADFPFYYPTAGASEALRHVIYDWAACRSEPVIHVFEGEYEGYKAMAEAAGVRVVEHARADWKKVASDIKEGRWSGAWDRSLFFISAPSAIDGNLWADLNAFVAAMPDNSVVMDVTYVGAIPYIVDRIRLDLPAVKYVVFSLSKPFGGYYDRMGGIWCRQEDGGLFGNKWFKNLTSLALGTALMRQHSVFSLPRRYQNAQEEAVDSIGHDLGLPLAPSDVFILATAVVPENGDYDPEMVAYLRRPVTGNVRVCLTPFMAEIIGTT